MKLATAAQMKELDRQAIQGEGIPSLELMERAAAGITEAVLELLPGKTRRGRVTVFCGAGNNGGDGIAAARQLFLEGVSVRVFLVGDYEKLTEDALEMTRALSEYGIELEPYDPENEDQQRWQWQSHVFIDALFGVGLSRPIGEDSLFAQAICRMNRCPGKVVAADIVSGVDASTGKILGLAVQADRTVTFTFGKIGQYVGEGAMRSGAVTVWDIGIPEKLKRAMVCSTQTADADFARWALPVRRADGHKGTFGKLLIVGGSVGYTGAPWLTATAAERTGCGLIYLGVPESIWPIEAAKCVGTMPFPLPEQAGKLREDAAPEVLERLKTCDVLALGPGLGRSMGTEELTVSLLRQAECPVVLDADGINVLAAHMDVLDERRGRITVLTPHDGEFARLTGLPIGEITGGARAELARQFAAEHGCVLALKGHRTVIAAPGGNVLVNVNGNSGLARGGSGDVLTGIIASLLCQGATALQAAGLGVWLHGRAGDLAAEKLTPYAMTPEDVMGCLPESFRELTEE